MAHSQYEDIKEHDGYEFLDKLYSRYKYPKWKKFKRIINLLHLEEQYDKEYLKRFYKYQNIFIVRWH